MAAKQNESKSNDVEVTEVDKATETETEAKHRRSAVERLEAQLAEAKIKLAQRQEGRRASLNDRLAKAKAQKERADQRVSAIEAELKEINESAGDESTDEDTSVEDTDAS